MKLGDNISRQRKKHGLSCYKLAKMTGLSISTIVRLESGEMSNPNLSTILKLSEVFGISIETLVFGG